MYFNLKILFFEKIYICLKSIRLKLAYFIDEATYTLEYTEIYTNLLKIFLKANIYISLFKIINVKKGNFNCF